jgi:hypothetical protein
VRDRSGTHVDLAALGRSVGEVPALVQALYIAVPLGVVMATGLALQSVARGAIRLMEGYWPAAVASVADRRRSALSTRAARQAEELRALAARPLADLTGAEAQRRARLERLYRQVPGAARSRMPTRLGNLLRASELRTSQRYGLDAVVCWPRLWLLLPDQSRKEVSGAYAGVTIAAQVVVCGVAILPLAVWAWWAVPAGLMTVAIGHLATVRVCETFAVLVESCYDLHRRLLYAALHWPVPTDPADERRRGRQITTYLVAGSKRAVPTFIDDAPAPPAAPADRVRLRTYSTPGLIRISRRRTGRRPRT